MSMLTRKSCKEQSFLFNKYNDLKNKLNNFYYEILTLRQRVFLEIKRLPTFLSIIIFMNMCAIFLLSETIVVNMKY